MTIQSDVWEIGAGTRRRNRALAVAGAVVALLALLEHVTARESGHYRLDKRLQITNGGVPC